MKNFFYASTSIIINMYLRHSMTSFSRYVFHPTFDFNFALNSKLCKHEDDFAHVHFFVDF